MINKLIKLASQLEKKGKHIEADKIDQQLIKFAQYGYNMMPVSPYSPQYQNYPQSYQNSFMYPYSPQRPQIPYPVMQGQYTQQDVRMEPSLDVIIGRALSPVIQRINTYQQSGMSIPNDLINNAYNEGLRQLGNYIENPYIKSKFDEMFDQYIQTPTQNSGYNRTPQRYQPAMDRSLANYTNRRQNFQRLPQRQLPPQAAGTGFYMQGDFYKYTTPDKKTVQRTSDGKMFRQLGEMGWEEVK